MQKKCWTREPLCAHEVILHVQAGAAAREAREVWAVAVTEPLLCLTEHPLASDSGAFPQRTPSPGSGPWHTRQAEFLLHGAVCKHSAALPS